LPDGIEIIAGNGQCRQEETREDDSESEHHGLAFSENPRH
jgi:hypothetical protein